MTTAVEPVYCRAAGNGGCWAAECREPVPRGHPRLHCCALPHHKETLAPCNWKASKELCGDCQLGGQYLLEKCLLSSKFAFFLLHKCCLVAVNPRTQIYSVSVKYCVVQLSQDLIPSLWLGCLPASKAGLGYLWKANFQCLLFLIVAKYFEQSYLKGHLC